MSPTAHIAVPRVRVAVVLGGWGLAVLLLAVVAIAASVGWSELPEASEVGPVACVVGLVAVSAQAAVLLWARPSTRLALLGVAAVVPLAAAAGLGAATGVTSVAVMIAACLIVIDVPWPRPAEPLTSAAALIAVGDLVRALREEGWVVGDWILGALGEAVLQGAGVVFLAAVVGAIVASRRETARARAGRDVAVAGEQAALTQAAVARERVAMARELHDIAAHHLSGIAVMTAALDRQIDTDPAGAKTAVRQVRQQSTAMLRDLRSLVSLLRDDAPGRAEPQVRPETLRGIPGLVESARLAGRNVEFSVLGAAQIPSLGIGPLAELAAYRTVQESLSNAARHAPGARCEVVIDVRDPSVVVLTVRNEAPSTPPPSASAASSVPRGGFGIVGMRERADLTGAVLSAGPTPEGGWVVRLAVTTQTLEDPL